MLVSVLQAFESPAELAAAAVACVHGLSAGTDWGLPSEILLAVKHALSANQFSTDSADQQSDAHLLEAVAQLDQVSLHRALIFHRCPALLHFGSSACWPSLPERDTAAAPGWHAHCRRLQACAQAGAPAVRQCMIMHAQARTHVKGAELLGQLGQATTPQKLARADKAAIARLLRTCLARLSRSRPPPSDARSASQPAASHMRAACPSSSGAAAGSIVHARAPDCRDMHAASYCCCSRIPASLSHPCPHL